MKHATYRGMFELGSDTANWLLKEFGPQTAALVPRFFYGYKQLTRKRGTSPKVSLIIISPYLGSSYPPAHDVQVLEFDCSLECQAFYRDFLYKRLEALGSLVPYQLTKLRNYLYGNENDHQNCLHRPDRYRSRPRRGFRSRIVQCDPQHNDAAVDCSEG